MTLIEKLQRRIRRLRARVRRLRRKQREPLSLSENGAQFIADFEGYFSHPYNDPAGHCTIGYGTLLHLGNCTKRDHTEWKGGVSKQRALEMLKAEADDISKIVRDMVTVRLNQNQHDALVSFTYNVGAGAFMSSTLLRKLNAGEYSAVPSEMSRWVKAGGITLPGLVRRRKAEANLFTTPVKEDR